MLIKSQEYVEKELHHWVEFSKKTIFSLGEIAASGIGRKYIF